MTFCFPIPMFGIKPLDPEALEHWKAATVAQKLADEAKKLADAKLAEEQAQLLRIIEALPELPHFIELAKSRQPHVLTHAEFGQLKWLALKKFAQEHGHSYSLKEKGNHAQMLRERLQQQGVVVLPRSITLKLHEQQEQLAKQNTTLEALVNTYFELQEDKEKEAEMLIALCTRLRGSL